MEFYQSKLLNGSKNIFHIFTTTTDGNIAFHVGDDIDNVIENHYKLSQKYNYNLDSLVHMKQIHSNIVKIIDNNDNFKNPPTADALITNKKNIPIMVMVADCTPILLHDPKQNVIAVIHAGRAGAFNNIIKNVLDTFKNHFNSNVKDILVAIGPAICQQCYEVSKDIYQEAKYKNLEFSVKIEHNRYYLNIENILTTQLKNEGIKNNHIDILNICSKCNQNFFSYREKKDTGRFSGIIYLK